MILVEFPQISQKTKKIETNKSLDSNEDLSNEDSESISLLKSKRDDELQFSFKEFVRGPRDPKRATSFIAYLNKCEGEERKGLVTSKLFLPLVTKAIRDLIDPSQLKVPMTLTNSDQGLSSYIYPGFVESPPDKYREKTPGGNPFFQWSVESIDLSSMAMVILEILLKN